MITEIVCKIPGVNLYIAKEVDGPRWAIYRKQKWAGYEDVPISSIPYWLQQDKKDNPTVPVPSKRKYANCYKCYFIDSFTENGEEYCSPSSCPRLTGKFYCEEKKP